MKEGKFEIILRELLERRCTFHRSASEECEQRWDRIAKPIDGLGELEKNDGEDRRYDGQCGCQNRSAGGGRHVR